MDSSNVTLCMLESASHTSTLAADGAESLDTYRYRALNEETFYENFVEKCSTQ